MYYGLFFICLVADFQNEYVVNKQVFCFDEEKEFQTISGLKPLVVDWTRQIVNRNRLNYAGARETVFVEKEKASKTKNKSIIEHNKNEEMLS